MEILKSDEKVKHIRFGYSEFVDFAENRKRSDRSMRTSQNSSRSVTNKENPWAGTNTFEEALNLARHGWDAGLLQLPLESGTLENTGIEIENAISGAMVNIGNYLMGQPDCMINFKETREFNLEELTIYVRLDYNCGTNYEQAMNFCYSISEIVNVFQSKYNVRIIGRFDTKEDGINSIVDVVIKDFDQRFTMNNIAFSFHPAFFRRIWFSYIESEEFIAGGYGMTSSSDKINNDLKKEGVNGLTVITPHIESTERGKFGIEKITKLNF